MLLWPVRTVWADPRFQKKEPCLTVLVRADLLLCSVFFYPDFNISAPLILCLIGAGCAGKVAEEKINFESLASGFDSQVTEKNNIVIREQGEFEKIWSKLAQNKPPEIDFEKNKVIAVFQEEQPTGGYEVETEKITQTGQEFKVYVKEMVPDPSGTVTQVQTYPYHMIKIPLIDKPVEFVEP